MTPPSSATATGSVCLFARSSPSSSAGEPSSAGRAPCIPMFCVTPTPLERSRSAPTSPRLPIYSGTMGFRSVTIYAAVQDQARRAALAKLGALVPRAILPQFRRIRRSMEPTSKTVALKSRSTKATGPNYEPPDR